MIIWKCRVDDQVEEFPGKTDSFPFRLRKCFGGKVFQGKYTSCKKSSGHVEYSFKYWPKNVPEKLSNSPIWVKKWKGLLFENSLSIKMSLDTYIAVLVYLSEKKMLNGQFFWAQSARKIKKRNLQSKICLVFLYS